jgi:hypothetical protein
MMEKYPTYKEFIAYDPRLDKSNQRMIKEGQKAQKFLSKSKASQYGEAFIKTLPKSIYEFAIEQPLKFLASTAETVPTIATGGKYTPKLGGFVSQAKGKLQEGAKPFGWKAMGSPALQTVTSGLEVYGYGKLIRAYSKMKLSKKSLNQTSSILKAAQKKAAGARKVAGSKALGVKKVATASDKEIARAAEPYISNNIVKTENNLKGGIEKIATRLSDDINKSSKPISWKLKKELLEEIDSINPSIMTKADPVNSSAFNQFKEKMLTNIGTAKNDADLFNIRKELDRIVTRETNGKIWTDSGRFNPIYEVWRGGRGVLNKFTSSRIKGVSESLKKQSMLYDALEGVAEKTGKLIDKPGVIQKTLKGGMKWGAAIGAAYLLGRGRGSAINID